MRMIFNAYLQLFESQKNHFESFIFFLRIFASAADWFKSENKKWKISVDMQIN